MEIKQGNTISKLTEREQALEEQLKSRTHELMTERAAAERLRDDIACLQKTVSEQSLIERSICQGYLQYAKQSNTSQNRVCPLQVFGLFGFVELLHFDTSICV